MDVQKVGMISDNIACRILVKMNIHQLLKELY